MIINPHTKNTVKMLDLEKIRGEFPILNQKINGNPLIYLDNAASTQKPLAVIEALEHYYKFDNANIHRGIHTLSERATTAYEETRETVRQFINARSTEEIIFTSGTTDGINLAAVTFGKAYINTGDEVIISAMEHHSNIVPWQMICEERGAVLKVIPMNDKGELLLDEFGNLLSEKTKLVAVVHVSNTLGTVNPVKEITGKAHEFGAKVLIDGAQAIQHFEINVQELDCDFYTFSSHKIYGPTGTGILYGKKELLEELPPYRGGGEMIKEVTFEKTVYNDLPFKFEAGTPNIADAITLKTALDYVQHLGKSNIAAYEEELRRYTEEKLSEIEGLRIIGTAKNKVSVVSFIIEGIHHQDLGVLLDNMGIAVRTGHHCTQPVMDRFGIPGTVRVSLAFYNTKNEIDALTEGIQKAVGMLR